MWGPQWFSDTLIIAEGGWHFPQCRYAKSFAKVHASPAMILKNDDYSWEGLTFSSIMRDRFQKYVRSSQWCSKTLIIAKGDWYFPQCRYVTSFWKYMWGPQCFSKTMIIAERDWNFPRWRYAKSFSKSTCEPPHSPYRLWKIHKTLRGKFPHNFSKACLTSRNTFKNNQMCEPPSDTDVHSNTNDDAEFWTKV